MIRFIIHFLIFILLTILTQVGGIIYLFTFLVIKNKQKKYKLKRVLFFCVIYLFVTFIILPFLAPLFGRQKINNNENLQAHFYGTILLNRSYVTKDLYSTLEDVAREFQLHHPNSKLIYLDANFPFFDGFPLLPHLSHNDGKKIDLAFLYKDASGNSTKKKPSNSGYGIFEKPWTGEIDQTDICKKSGAWKYDFTKYLTFGSSKNLTLDNNKTKTLIQILSKQTTVEKIFIEPHLKKRWKLQSEKIRFQGCKAVRHDDHIHVQIN